MTMIVHTVKELVDILSTYSESIKVGMYDDTAHKVILSGIYVYDEKVVNPEGSEHPNERVVILESM